MAEAWDVIIIGSGSAGATLAARLTQQPERRVLLIECGGRDHWPHIHIPGLLEATLAHPGRNWRYPGDPDPSLGGRSLTWAAGRVLGGSSSINGMVYGRGLPADYAGWVAAGNPGFGWDDMLPYFRRAERWSGTAHPSRGVDGPLAVRRFEDTDPSCQAALAALVDLGVPWVDDYNVGIIEGVGLTQATQLHGWRHSVARAYLGPVRRRPNLTVWTGSLALSLQLEHGRCVAVRVERGGRVITVKAEREIVLAAGAIGTPKLLLLSGIGAPTTLAPHGITVRHRLDAVGRHLNDHVNIRLSAFVDRPTYNSQRRGLAVVRHGLRFLASGSGPASSPANHGQAFVRTVVSPCRPEARGEVGLRSVDPRDPPRLGIALLQAASDRASLLRGCRLAVAALQQGPGRQMAAQIYAPDRVPDDDAGWLDFFRGNAGLNWHPTSSCRMGPEIDSVVGGDFRVHGLSGLSIVDASVMPTVTSGNTNAAVIALAEQAADIIAARIA
jgi:choline dehydrogenase